MDEQRQLRLRAMLEDAEVGAWVSWRADELILTTGYLPQWGASLCLLPRKGGPVLFNPGIEPTDHLPNGVEVREYPWGAAADPWTPLIEAMRDVLRERGLDQERIGYVPFTERSAPPVNSAEGQPLTPNLTRLLDTLTPAGSVDLTQQVEDQYVIKTDVEIDRIRLAHRVAALGIAAFYATLEPGKTEAEVASAVESAAQNQMGHGDVWFARGWAFIQAGPNAIDGGTFSRTTGRALRPGELVMIEMAVCVNGYWADITRTGAVRGGPVDTRHQTLFDVAAKAQALAVRVIGPGVPASDVDRVARDYITAHGYGDYFRHNLGHHVGLRYHDPGPALSPASRFALSPGMIVTVEPGIYGAALGTGARIEDNVLVTSEGCEILSVMPRSLDGK